MNRSASTNGARFMLPVLRKDQFGGAAANVFAEMRASRVLLAGTMIGLGVIGIIYGDFALVWQRIPIEQLPARQLFAYLFAAIELATGFGMLIERFFRPSVGALTAFMLVWVVSLKLPAVVVMPGMEATWLGFGEIAVIFAGAWILWAASANDDGFLHFAKGASGVRYARLLFALSLPMIGLSHFFYSKETVAFVPAWLPYKLGWAYLTGTGSIAACVAILFGVVPRLAATLEAAMLTIITLLVWAPGLFTKPGDRTQWTGFFISMAIAAGAWVVAASFRRFAWFAFTPLSSRLAAQPART